MVENKSSNEWYSNATFITNLILIVIIIAIVISQSFAVRSNDVELLDIIRSLVNHNFIYIVALVYFVFLKTNIGKKYFNFLNLF